MTLDSAERTVNEGDGFVQVCLELTAGQLGADVTVELNTGSPDDTATGMPCVSLMFNAEIIICSH